MSIISCDSLFIVISQAMLVVLYGGGIKDTTGEVERKGWDAGE